MKEFTCLCTSTKAFKSGFVKFCSYKKDLDLLRNLHAYVHACNGTKLLKSGFVKFCSDKKRTLFSICTYATKLFKSDLVKFCSNKKKVTIHKITRIHLQNLNLSLYISLFKREKVWNPWWPPWHNLMFMHFVHIKTNLDFLEFWVKTQKMTRFHHWKS